MPNPSTIAAQDEQLFEAEFIEGVKSREEDPFLPGSASFDPIIDGLESKISLILSKLDQIEQAAKTLAQSMGSLKELGRAAKRYMKARRVFEAMEGTRLISGPGATDAQTMEVAEAACELELLLERHANLLE